jgi:hypothetical protein
MKARKYRLHFILILLAGLALLGWGTQSRLAARTVIPAFQPGERLIYELRWESIKAGEAILEVLPMRQHNGKEVYHFALSVRSNSTLDHIYKVRDRIDAYADADMTRSIFYKQKLREGGYRKDDMVNFHWDKQEAVYIKKNKNPKTISLMEGTFDPLSAFYYVRNQYMTEGMKLECPVSDGRKNIVGRLTVVKRETITVQQGTFDTYLVEPDLREVGGVFRKSKNAKLRVWLTADERHIPVMIQSKVIIGHFVGELVSMNFPKQTVATAAD